MLDHSTTKLVPKRNILLDIEFSDDSEEEEPKVSRTRVKYSIASSITPKALNIRSDPVVIVISDSEDEDIYSLPLSKSASITPANRSRISEQHVIDNSDSEDDNMHQSKKAKLTPRFSAETPIIIDLSDVDSVSDDCDKEIKSPTRSRNASQ